MKKIIALSLAVLMALALLTGCSDPVSDDFENFLNVEMAGVTENYTKIRSCNMGITWRSRTDGSKYHKCYASAR